jgi:hypothetical protein
VAILADYVARLKSELLFGPDDPIFPAPKMDKDQIAASRFFGLSRDHWRHASTIRIVRNAFEAAGFDYPIPHRVRKTLARLGERKVHTPGEWKAWSQNLVARFNHFERI